MQSVDDLDRECHQHAADDGQTRQYLHRLLLGQWLHARRAPGASGKQVPYEENFRLPLFVRGPGIAAGKTMDQLVGNVDFAPTFAQWAGATVPDFVDGRSFAPLLSGGAADGWRQAFLIEHFNATEKGNGKKGKKAKKSKQATQGTAQPATTAQATPGAASGSAAAGKGATRRRPAPPGLPHPPERAKGRHPRVCRSSTACERRITCTSSMRRRSGNSTT